MAVRCSVGQELSNSYRLEKLIGRGGMGEVWQASHLRLTTKNVAIKVIYHQGQSLIERLEREAFVMSGLQHPHIVHIEDLLSLPTGEPFIVMELLNGISLHDRLAQGPVDYEWAEQWLFEAADAIDTAHRHGVIHRDLKPENLYLCNEEYLKVLDFGISSFNGGATLSSEGALIGTPFYMSPEQARGERVDPRSDLFSLGLIIIELLTGKRAIQGNSLHETLNHVVSFLPPSAPSGYSTERWSRLMSAVSLERSARPASVRAWISHALQRELPDRSINLKLKAQVTNQNLQSDEQLSKTLDAHLESDRIDETIATPSSDSLSLMREETVDTLEADLRPTIPIQAQQETTDPTIDLTLENATITKIKEVSVQRPHPLSEDILESPKFRLNKWIILISLLGLGSFFILFSQTNQISSELISLSTLEKNQNHLDRTKIKDSDGLPDWYVVAKQDFAFEKNQTWVVRNALKKALDRHMELDPNQRLLDEEQQSLIQQILQLSTTEGRNSKALDQIDNNLRSLESIQIPEWREPLNMLKLLVLCAQKDSLKVHYTVKTLNPSLQKELEPQLSLCWESLSF